MTTQKNKTWLHFSRGCKCFPAVPWQQEAAPDIKEDEKVGGQPWYHTVSQHVSCSTFSKKKNSALFISWQRVYSSRPLDSLDFCGHILYLCWWCHSWYAQLAMIYLQSTESITHLPFGSCCSPVGGASVTPCLQSHPLQLQKSGWPRLFHNSTIQLLHVDKLSLLQQGS